MRADYFQCTHLIQWLWPPPRDHQLDSHSEHDALPNTVLSHIEWKTIPPFPLQLTHALFDHCTPLVLADISLPLLNVSLPVPGRYHDASFP